MLSIRILVILLLTVVGPLVHAQQRITPTSDCFIGNITQGFGYDTNFEETGRYRNTASPNGAVGATRLVATVNRLIEVRRKDGTLLFRDSLVDFFSNITGTVRNETIIYNPKVIYDEYEGRFVVFAHQNILNTVDNRLLLAVSKNETPDTVNAWNFFGFNSSLSINNFTSYADFSGFEVDEEVLYINANYFSFATNGFTEQRLWIVNKGVIGGLYGGGTPFVHGPYNPNIAANNITRFVGTPAKVHGLGGVGGAIGTFLVAIRVNTIPPNVIQVVTISNPLNTPPTFSGIIIDLGLIALPFQTNPPQNGSATRIEGRFDTSLDAVWQNNKLYITANINPSSGVDISQLTVYWARLDTTGGTIKLETQGFLGGESFSNGTNTYYPSIDVNQQGYVGFGYVASSPTLYVGAYGSLLSGAVEQPFTVKSGLDVYRRRASNVNVNSFGYYSSITVDPTDDSFWIFNQFADTRGSPDNSTGDDGRWGTVWARVYCTSPPPPTKAPTQRPTKNPTRAPTKAPTQRPTRNPTRAPTKSPSKTPTKAPVVLTKTPTKSPINTLNTTISKNPTSAPTKSPTCNDCGLFGLNIFCPLTGCGVLGRLFGLC